MLAAVAVAALLGSASAFPLSQAAIKRGMGAPLKEKPLKTTAPLCCANNQDGSYVLLNSTSFVIIDPNTNTAQHPSIVNLATQYSRLGARLIQYFGASASAPPALEAMVVRSLKLPRCFANVLRIISTIS